MSRRTRLAIVAAVIGLVLPAAVTSSPAGALGQDLVVSAASGPPGTIITMSSAGCTSSDSLDADLEVELISGTAPDAVLAGVGSGSEGSATIEVPDWVDPAQPAVLEASCSAFDDDNGTESDLTYDPVAFDIEPGVGPATQVRTFSRTSLLAGQAFTVTGAGCTTAAPNGFALTLVVPGSDLSGRTIADGDEDTSAEGFGKVDASGAFTSLVAVTNASAFLDVSTSDDDQPEISTGEDPLTMPPGTYTVFSYCLASNDSILMLEPGTIEVTGAAPTDAIDLTIAANTRNLTLAGTECTQGDVSATLTPETLDDFTDFPGSPPVEGVHTALAKLRPAHRGAPAAHPSTPGIERHTALDQPTGHHSKIVGPLDGADVTATPDADGAWSIPDTAPFDKGIVWGYGACGDPLADGYYYDPQIAQVDVAPPVTTTTTSTTTTTAPPSGAATPIPGTPSYAG